nr:hypothetical protein [Tanacetum cinerariifolium]
MLLVNETKTSTSKTSKESLEKPKTVRPSAPIIEEWESDSEDENVVKKTEVKNTVKPSLEKIEFVNAKNFYKVILMLFVVVVNTARPKPVINAVRTNRVNDVKSSAWTKLETSVRLNSPKDKKRAGAELTQKMTSHSTRSKVVVDYILQVKIKLLIKNLKIQKLNIKFKGGMLGSRSFNSKKLDD